MDAVDFVAAAAHIAAFSSLGLPGMLHTDWHQRLGEKKVQGWSQYPCRIV